MSFVHCPSCHRAYDLRRQASCPACRHGEAAAVTEAATEAVPEAVPEALIDAGAGAPPRAGDVASRIAAMVAELAALVERDSVGELEAARQQLDRRGLRALWGAQPAAGGRWLTSGGERLVAGALDVAKRMQSGAAAIVSRDAPRWLLSAEQPRRLVRRLRAAWTGSPRA